MKFIILIIALVPAVLADRREEHVATAGSTATFCQEESGVEQEVLNTARAGIYTDDSKYKDYLFCYLKKMRLQNENGDVNIQVFREIITGYYSPARVEQIVRLCATKKGDTPSDTAFLVFRCYYGLAPNDHPPRRPTPTTS